MWVCGCGAPSLLSASGWCPRGSSGWDIKGRCGLLGSGSLPASSAALSDMGDEDIGMAGERWIWLIWVGRAATGNTLWVMWSLKPLLDNSMTLKAGKS